MLKLGQGQDITAVALNEDNTTLVASTADKQLIVFTNPSVSIPYVMCTIFIIIVQRQMFYRLPSIATFRP
jgi:hypothetical protein